jgi:large subunit ribosomal protein L18
MANANNRQVSRTRRHWRVRTRLSGDAGRPRLCVFRSLKHIYAQVVDDEQGQTLASASTACAAVGEELGDVKRGGNVAAATIVGRMVAERAKEKGVTKVRFDRGGYKYHGRIKALADAAREAGLEF